MKRIFIAILVVFCCALPGWAFRLQSFQIHAGDQVAITLLSMVISDVDMCRASLRPQMHNYGSNVLSIGHLNNAQSALQRANLGYEYRPLVQEIHSRLGKIKFYLVMNDLNNVSMRCQQLTSVLRSLIAGAGSVTVVSGNYPGQSSGQFGQYGQSGQSGQSGQTSGQTSGKPISVSYPPVEPTPPEYGTTVIINNPPVQQTPSRPVVIFNNPVNTQPIPYQPPVYIFPVLPSFPGFSWFFGNNGQNLPTNRPNLPIVPN